MISRLETLSPQAPDMNAANPERLVLPLHWFRDTIESRARLPNLEPPRPSPFDFIEGLLHRHVSDELGDKVGALAALPKDTPAQCRAIDDALAQLQRNPRYRTRFCMHLLWQARRDLQMREKCLVDSVDFTAR